MRPPNKEVARKILLAMIIHGGLAPMYATTFCKLRDPILEEYPRRVNFWANKANPYVHYSETDDYETNTVTITQAGIDLVKEYMDD